jgi:hypothetical protein
MKVKSTCIAVSVFCLAACLPCSAQVEVWHQGIQIHSVNLRGAPVVLGQQTISVTEPGDVLVQFDGSCFSSPGDRIVLAASNTIGWGVNDGAVAVEAYDNDVNMRSFSHSRMYSVGAGTHTFYAVGENYVEEDGTGIAAIYGSLTVKFFRYGIAVPAVTHAGVIDVNRNVRGASMVIVQSDINVSTAGDVIVRFDGVCMSDPGDRIVIAASNTTTWSTNDGTTAVEAINNDLNITPFCHSRMYSVGAGLYTFYGVAENLVETDGSGIASFYGSLTLEFFPSAVGGSFVQHAGVSQTNVDVRGAPVIMGQLAISPTNSGTAVVRYEGLCVSSAGDRIIMAANSIPDWTSDDGNVGVEAVDSDLNFNTFSHTRSYSVAPGSHTFYAVCENWVETEGTGIASNYASLSVEFIPDILTAVEEEGRSLVEFVLKQNVPNPFNPVTTIQYKLHEPQQVTLHIYDVSGRLVHVLLNAAYEESGKHEATWYGLDDSGRPVASGTYFYRLTAGTYAETRRMVLVR